VGFAGLLTMFRSAIGLLDFESILDVVFVFTGLEDYDQVHHVNSV